MDCGITATCRTPLRGPMSGFRAIPSNPLAFYFSHSTLKKRGEVRSGPETGCRWSTTFGRKSQKPAGEILENASERRFRRLYNFSHPNTNKGELLAANRCISASAFHNQSPHLKKMSSLVVGICLAVLSGNATLLTSLYLLKFLLPNPESAHRTTGFSPKGN